MRSRKDGVSFSWVYLMGGGVYIMCGNVKGSGRFDVWDEREGGRYESGFYQGEIWILVFGRVHAL